MAFFGVVVSLSGNNPRLRLSALDVPQSHYDRLPTTSDFPEFCNGSNLPVGHVPETGRDGPIPPVWSAPVARRR